MSGRMVPVTVYMSLEQADALDALRVRTGVPLAEYVRQGIDLALSRRRDEPAQSKQLELPWPDGWRA